MFPYDGVDAARRRSGAAEFARPLHGGNWFIVVGRAGARADTRHTGAELPARGGIPRCRNYCHRSCRLCTRAGVEAARGDAVYAASAGRESANGDALDQMQSRSLLLLHVSAIKDLFETKRTDHNDILI
jgi:hypothetical protein